MPKDPDVTRSCPAAWPSPGSALRRIRGNPVANQSLRTRLLIQVMPVHYRRPGVCGRMPLWQRGEETEMTLSWIMLGLVGWAAGLVFVLILMRMSGDQDRAARHEQKHLDPYSDITITQAGSG
jgi:hypothetical protein